MTSEETKITEDPDLYELGIDFDEWLATGERTTHHLNLYARFDLIADIDELKAKLPEDDGGEESNSDGSLGGGDDEYEEIRNEIRELYRRIDASKRPFRVTSLTQVEINQMSKDIRAEYSEELDQIAGAARAEGAKDAKRLGITNANEKTAFIRNAGKNAVDDFVSHRVTVRMIASSAQTQNRNGEWANLPEALVEKLYDALGEAQMVYLSQAALEATRKIPEVTLPKS